MPAPIPVAPAATMPPARRVAAAEPRVEEEEPVMSGPSFLGLNQPPPRQSSRSERRGTLSINPNTAPPSRDLDYLLEDDEPKRGGGGWTAVAIFLALALAVGLGYLRWRNQGFGWLNLGAKHSAAQTADDSSAATAPTSNPAGQSPSSGADPAGSGNAAAPATNPAAPGDASNAATAPTNPAPAANAPDSTATPAPSQPSATASPAATPETPPDAKQPSTIAAAPALPAAGRVAGAASADDSGDPADRAKPSAASEPPKPVKPVDPVAEAQKYLYGKGVPQNCDRGLRLLKPAADHGNGKAMIEMGALYSAGLCTPRDLPTAYRWFALALRKEPDNDAVQTDLQKLWGEMTQPERQLAIKLSQ